MVNRRDVPIDLAIPIACKKLLKVGAELAEKRMLDEAIIIFEQLVFLGFRDAYIYTNLGQAYHEKGLTGKAEKYYRKAIRAAPKDEIAYERLGTLYSEKGDFTNAIKYFEKGLKRNPNDYVLLTNMGKALFDKGFTKKAKEYLEKSKKIKVTAFARNLLGLIHLKLGLKEKAIGELKEAIKLEPNNWLFHSNLGDIFFENGLWINARDEYLEWVELDPDSAASHNNLGAAYANTHQPELAEKEFNKAIQLDPSLEIAISNLDIVSEVKAKFEKYASDRNLVSLIPTEGYCEITGFEENFRLFISRVMEKMFGHDWWKLQVPPDVVERCQVKKEIREKRALTDIENLDPIFYADFSDYAAIIEKRDNWKQVFKEYFPDRQGILVKLREASPIRNDIVHRGLHVSPHDLAKLKIYIKEITYCIRREITDKE
ncbi:MAG: tetratricopeptide repeat protein [Candidatus Bathyarchaeia archaeon]|jgi:tetratricopeptide (TPR) repeat protein